MEIYYTIFFVLVIFSFLDRTGNLTYSKLFFRIGIIFFIIFVGIRYEVGNDYHSYYLNYLGINSNGYTDSKEIIYVLFNKIFNFESVIFLFSCLSFFFLYKSIKYFNVDYSNTILLVYYSFFLVTFNLHIIRQGLAVALVLYSYKFLYEKKYILFLIFVLVASGFHISALIVIPISYFFKYEINKKIQIFILFISLVISYNIDIIMDFYYLVASNIPILNKYLLYYRQGEVGQYTFSMGMLFDILILLVLMSKQNNFSEKNKFLYNIFYISVILSLLLVVDEAALRLNYYFRIVIIFLLPFVITQFKVKLFVKFFIILACFLYLYQTFNAIGEYGKGDRNLHYKTIINR